MPSTDTFTIQPIRMFVHKYLRHATVSVDPFARNNSWATWTNDINPETKAAYHLDAGAFLDMLYNKGVKADLVLFDPPYSPRQIAECYHALNIDVTMQTTQSAAFKRQIREKIHAMLALGGIVLSFGWNSVGMGIERGYKPVEMLIVCHGGDHNDTLCVAEMKMQSTIFDMMTASDLNQAQP